MFLPATGLSRERAEELSQDPAMEAVSPTMLDDFEMLGYTDQGAAIPQHAVRFDIPTLAACRVTLARVSCVTLRKS
jgi:hypothetical protein